MDSAKKEAEIIALRGILRGYPWEISGMRFSPDGQRLVIPADRATIDTWDLSSFEKCSALPLDIRLPATLAFSPDLSTFAVSKAESVVHLRSLEGVSLAELAGHVAS